MYGAVCDVLLENVLKLVLRVYPVRFGIHTVKYMPKLMKRGEGKPRVGPNVCGPEIYAAMSWQDWPEANLREVGIYLRGSRALNLGAAWRAVFPTTW